MVLRRFRPMGDLIGYARVSTTEQNPALQLDALHAGRDEQRNEKCR